MTKRLKPIISSTTSHKFLIMKLSLPLLTFLNLNLTKDTVAYSTNSNSIISRRKLFGAACTSCLIGSSPLITPFIPLAQAFDGSGASAYSGRNPLTNKAEQRKIYQDRITADVKDFKALGKAIDNGILEGDTWVNFFIQYQRREPDSVGRSYAALADLIGTKEFSGCGILLATSFAKSGKPADGLPQVKKYNILAKTFEPIRVAGDKGDAKKAKTAWNNASVALSEYLEEVGLPASLDDSLYN